MTLNNINTMKKDRGFTLVELMIVIVVIAILAAISIVAFAGIQQRGRDASRQSDIESLAKGITTWVGDDQGGNGTWPAVADFTATDKIGAYTVVNVKGIANKDVGSEKKVVAGPITAAKKDQYGYEQCTVSGNVTGAKLTWIKESNNNSVEVVKLGSGCA